MANIIGKFMSKFTLGSLEDRQARLTEQRDAAKATLEKARAARLQHRLEGDISDTKTSAALQLKVAEAESTLDGFEEALTEQSKRVSAANQALDKERKEAKQKMESEALAADVAVIKNKIPSWLADTRHLASLLSKHETFRFEAGSIARYLVNASNEVDVALSVTVPDLERGVINILEGSESAPDQPASIIKAPQIAPAPLTAVFSLKPIAWSDHDGTQQTQHAWFDCDLPSVAAARAIRLGAACSMSDPRRKAQRGYGKTFAKPKASTCVNLDSDAQPEAPDLKVVAPVAHLAFEKPTVGPAFNVRVPRNEAVPASATRELKEDKS